MQIIQRKSSDDLFLHFWYISASDSSLTFHGHPRRELLFNCKHTSPKRFSAMSVRWTEFWSICLGLGKNTFFLTSQSWLFNWTSWSRLCGVLMSCDDAIHLIRSSVVSLWVPTRDLSASMLSIWMNAMVLQKLWIYKSAHHVKPVWYIYFQTCYLFSTLLPIHVWQLLML